MVDQTHIGSETIRGWCRVLRTHFDTILDVLKIIELELSVKDQQRETPREQK